MDTPMRENVTERPAEFTETTRELRDHSTSYGTLHTLTCWCGHQIEWGGRFGRSKVEGEQLVLAHRLDHMESRFHGKS